MNKKLVSFDKGMNSPRKILVVRFSSIGDIVLTTPVLRALKTQIVDCEIDFITKEQFRPLLEGNPNVSEIITINSSVGEVSNILKKKKYDFVIDLHNNIRSNQVKRLVKSPSGTLRKHNIGKFILVNTGMDLLPQKHIVERYFDAANSIAIKLDDEGLEFYYPDNFESSINPPKEPYIVCAIGGQHIGKRLPSEKWVELFKECPNNYVLVGGPEDQQAGLKISSDCPGVINMVGACNLFESAKLIENAAAVISNDTGMMHIASAFKKSIISLWGQTTPRFGMYPYKPGENSAIVEPCASRKLSKLGNRKTSVHVMESIDTAEICSGLQKILGK